MDVSLERARKILNELTEKQYLLKTKIDGKNRNLYKLLILVS